MADPLKLARQAEPALLDLLRQLVEIESPTGDKAANDRLGRVIAAELESVGGQVEVFPQTEYGDHLLARWPGRGRHGLIIGHRDTVWPAGTLARTGYERSDGRIYGPGVLDMKGGIAATLVALGLLRDNGLWPDRPLRFLNNSDEEKGSTTSRRLIESEAEGAAYVIVMEPGQGLEGKLATRRKGVGEFRVSVEGRACHASRVPEQGVSAIQELARQISRIYELSDSERGTTVSVGLVKGGTARNTVAAHAECVVDVRVSNAAEAERVAGAMRGLRRITDGARVVAVGGFHRPPMERTPAIAGLVERVKALATDLGIDLQEVYGSGGSDANLTAAVGAPTVDSMGAVGENPHAEGEYILVDELVRRTALLVHVLASL